MTGKWYPHKGKFTLKRLIKRQLEASGGVMPVENLLENLKKLGYLKEPIRRCLHQLDMRLADGKVWLRG